MTTPPNAPEVDVLSVLTVAACSVASLANIRRDAGLNLAADIYEQESKEIDLARTVVAALLTREAALVARNADLEQGLASACHAGRGLSSICTEYRKQLEAMTAERDALAAEVGALTSARDAYRTMLWQAEEDVKALREDAERWREVERRFNGSKTSAASMALEGLGLEPTPYRDFAETVDVARAEPGT